MNLGENIYRFRTDRNMSQGALADALEVSRQSVSKWENNSATPELDKLLKMSALFGVTLDQLVGKESPISPALEPVTQAVPEAPIHRSMSGRVITGIILVCFGVLSFLILSILGGIINGMILSLPFFIFAAICLLCKTRVLLKCCWALLVMVCEYLSFATGASRRTLFVYLLTDISNYLDYPYIVYAVISLIINVLLILLIIWTIFSYNRNHTPLSTRGKRCLIIGWIVFAVLCFLQLPRGEYGYDLVRLISALQRLFDWIKAGLFTTLLTYSLRLLPNRKENSHDTR